LLQNLYANFFVSQGLSEKQMREAIERFRQTGRDQIWPSDDPAQTALMSGEYEDALNRFADGLKYRLEDMGLLSKT
jgi:hypothetical protein